MKLLPFLQLAFTALTAGLGLPGSTFLDRRPPDDAVTLHLLRSCPANPPQPSFCRWRRSSAPTPVTTLLLNFTTADLNLRVVRQMLWISCAPGMKSHLKVILHDRSTDLSSIVRWRVTTRGCVNGTTVVYSNDTITSRPWTTDVDAASTFSLSMCSGYQLYAEDESDATPNADNFDCHLAAASRLLPILPVLLRKKEKGRFPRGVRWIHLDVPPGAAALPVRLEVGVRGGARPLLLLSANDSRLHFSLAISRGGPGAKLDILSSQPILVSSRPRDLASSIRSGLSRLELQSLLKQRFGGDPPHPSRFILHDMLSTSLSHSPVPSGVLLRVSFEGSTAPQADKEKAPSDLVTSRCEQDGYVMVVIDSTRAKMRGLSPDQFSVKADFCKFSWRAQWHLRFRFGDCGSLRLQDPLRSRIVFINNVSLTIGRKSSVIHSITCVEPMQPSEKVILEPTLSYSPMVGENVSINFTSEFYADFNILACGVYGGKFPIYNIYFENKAVDNRLLFFDVLPSTSRFERRVFFRFKRNYPYGKDPRFKIYCVLEGCRQGQLRKRTTDGFLQCSSGRRILRSKTLVAFILVKSKTPAIGADMLLGPSVHLLASVCIAAASFVLGVITVFGVYCICRRRTPHPVLRVTADM